MSELGHEEGQTCGREGCTGVIKLSDKGDCSCHINPPCGSCTEPREYCEACGWRAIDDERGFNDFLVRGPYEGPWQYRPRPLDPTKIDWRSKGHTHFTMIKEGVYPPSGDAAADRKAVEAKVRGTFGGRFRRFGDGWFEYVAYTD